MIDEPTFQRIKPNIAVRDETMANHWLITMSDWPLDRAMEELPKLIEGRIDNAEQRGPLPTILVIDDVGRQEADYQDLLTTLTSAGAFVVEPEGETEAETFRTDFSRFANDLLAAQQTVAQPRAFAAADYQKWLETADAGTASRASGQPPSRPSQPDAFGEFAKAITRLSDNDLEENDETPGLTANSRPVICCPGDWSVPMPDQMLRAHEVMEYVYNIADVSYPVSIRDQMNRARWIVQKAYDLGFFGPNRQKEYQNLLVCGAGAAGVTAALQALGLGVQTVLVERSAAPFLRQRLCRSRWLDPAQYDWPAPFWASGSFPYPLSPAMPLPWSADRSRDEAFAVGAEANAQDLTA